MRAHIDALFEKKRFAEEEASNAWEKLKIARANYEDLLRRVEIAHKNYRDAVEDSIEKNRQKK